MADSGGQKEWYSQQELAEKFNVDVDVIWKYVGPFSAGNMIRTMRDPKDRRRVLVHHTGIEAVRRAVLGESDAATA
ncbi:MAG: winged helix-turn-helix transcriptional regulator [Ktedonobacterales bacterium]|nr:winged helix-turn-helix transcriptional regulator [Ktedonobacterales bacterium]